MLSGADPFDGVTVSAGATATSTRTNSTDGSFNITMTISGSDGSSQPFALAVVNSGTGSLDTSGYSGTFSAECFIMPFTTLKFRPGIVSDITGYNRGWLHRW